MLRLTWINLNLTDEEEAIASGIFYDPSSRTFILDEELVTQNIDISQEVLAGYQEKLNNISSDEAEAAMQSVGADVNQNDSGEVSTQVAPAIIYGGVAAFGLFLGAAVIFSALYFNHQQKMNLIDRCYDEGGTPQVDSADSAGLNGTKNSSASSSANGYEFECVE